MHWGTRKTRVTHCTVISALLWWPGTQTTVSPRCACKSLTAPWTMNWRESGGRETIGQRAAVVLAALI